MQTAECRMAVEHVTAYLESPELHRAEVDAALRHIRMCPHCERRMKHLIRALTAAEKDRLTCSQCQDQLPDYHQAVMDGQSDESRWRPVSLHLAVCPHCGAMYTNFTDLINMANEDEGTEPSYYPVPRLDFLRRKKSRSLQSITMLWRLVEVGHLVVQFSTELVHGLTPLVPQPAYIARQKSSLSSAILYQFILKDAIENLKVTMTVEQEHDNPDRCRVIAEVNIPSRGGWPNLGGIVVILSRDEQVLETQMTDNFGEAVFEGIAIADISHLTFDIKPGI